MDQVQVDRIVLLHSLGEEDLGVTLRIEENIRDLIAQYPLVTCERVEVKDRKSLASAAVKLAVEVTSRGVPLVHLDMHGDESNGLRLSSGERVSWKELSSLLKVINRNTHNRMMVLSCACFSLATIAYYDMLSPAPFSLFSAPVRKISNGEIEDRTKQFYRSLLDRSGLEIMQKALGPSFYHYRPEDLIFYIVRDEMRSFRGRGGAEKREKGVSHIVNGLRNEKKDFELKDVRHAVRSFEDELTDGILHSLLEVFMCGRAPYFSADDVRLSKATPSWIKRISEQSGTKYNI